MPSSVAIDLTHFADGVSALDAAHSGSDGHKSRYSLALLKQVHQPQRREPDIFQYAPRRAYGGIGASSV